MKHSTFHRLLALLMCASAAVLPIQSGAEDIDIFVGSSAGAGANPKILIVLDNSANWSRASQQWPGGLTQGQSEARSIQSVVNGAGSSIDMGLMEYATNGGGDSGGFIRKAVTTLDTANTTLFSNDMTTIFNNINDPNEKVNSSKAYGDLMWSAYNYFAGGAAIAPSSSVVASIADSGGYTANYTTFKSPLADSNACGRNFVIFIANNDPNPVNGDTTANGAGLVALGGSISPQLPYQNYTTTTINSNTSLGYSSACYANLAACSAAEPAADFSTQCASGGVYSSCACDATNTTTSLSSCTAGQARFAVYGVTHTGGTTTTTGPTTGTATTSSTLGQSACYTNSTNASNAVTASSNSSSGATVGTDTGGMSCPAGTTSTSGNTTTVTAYSCSYALNSTSPSATATQNCSPSLGAVQQTTPTPAPTITSAATPSTLCYKANGQGTWTASSGDYGGLTCPVPSSSTANGVITTTTYSCPATSAGYTAVQGTSCGTSPATYHFNVTQKATGTVTTQTTTPQYKYDVKQVVTPSVTTTTTSNVTVTQALLGNTSLCYASATSAATSTEFSTQCSTYNNGCVGNTATASGGLCASGARYNINGVATSQQLTPTGTTSVPTDGANADEWARFMHEPHAINAANPLDTVKQSITTYTIDVFNKQENAGKTALLQSMAAAGGGKYFKATSEADILAALKSILAEIQSVNSTFASASLPVNATNRTQNANQVFIGMFRPDPDAKPRWFGNLKQYAVGSVNGALDLVDASGAAATNALTGFIADCAASFWTTDSGNYFGNLAVQINPDPITNCPVRSRPAASTSAYSDLPDGPTVEKGAVAEVLRKGNNPSAATASYIVNRTMLTLDSTNTSMVTFNATNSGLSGASTNNLVGFIQGADVNDDSGSGGATTTTTRPSIHGDVVHSRPLPINYGGTNGVTVYYGANDGTLRAVDASTSGSLGKERWAFVAPELYSKLQRQMDNTPPVCYPSVVALGLACSKKDYFFDGSFGVYQNSDSSKVWIYPTQRRGGRMMYGMDVTTPTSNPVLKWRNGCPNLTDDTGCTSSGSSYSAMGQSWSTPNVAFVKGFSTTTPVLLIGGGYDACEDVDSATKACGSAKGQVIYVINADTGAIIRSFTTTGSVASEISFIDLDNDGFVDYAYAADTNGNIYRIDFVDAPTTLVALTSANWKFRKVAYTTGGSRKFLFQPAVFPTGTTTYLAIVSGDREHPLIANYPYQTPVVNRAYVYRDDLTLSTGAVDLDGSTMLDFTSSTGSTCATLDTNSLLSANNNTPTNKKNGWFMSLTANGTGEQGVTSAVIVGGMVTFSTNRPEPSPAQSCGRALGEARGYFVNLFNASGSIATSGNASCGGNRSSTFAGGGLPPSPVIGIVPINGVPTAVLIGAVQRDGTNSSPIKPSRIVPPISQNRTRTYKSINTDK